MNAIIALCHFCEMHGPKVVFCTQAFHSEEPAHLVLSSNGTVSPPCPGENSAPGKKNFYGNISNWSKLVTSSPSTSSAHAPLASCTDTCEACRSLSHNGPGYISNDDEARVSYVSSQYPHKAELFSIVRQACVRSLSCEVCPGREGPIFFGDEQREQVFSYTFYLRDSRARGFQRWYSIIVLMMDKMFLLSSWPFLTRHCRRLIEELQGAAGAVYDAEQAECPQRAARLKHLVVSAGIDPRNFRRHRRSGGTDQARSLPALTRDDKVFIHLHVWFTWILRAGGNRMREKLLEGGPQSETDAVIDMDTQEETEEGFVNVLTKRVIGDGVAGADSGDDIQVLDSDGSEEGAMRPLRFTSLRHVLRVLEYDTFHTLAYNAIIGNQIICRGHNKTLVKSLLQHLSSLLPSGCCKVLCYSDTYRDLYNLLGLRAGVDVPSAAASSRPYILLDITRRVPPAAGGEAPPEDGIRGAYSFTLHECDTRPAPPLSGPTILKYFERKMAEPKLTNEVLDHVLIAAKEKWMNKVKVVYKYCQAGNHSTIDVDRVIQTLSEDKQEDGHLLRFWMRGLSECYRRSQVVTGLDAAAAAASTSTTTGGGD